MNSVYQQSFLNIISSKYPDPERAADYATGQTLRHYYRSFLNTDFWRNLKWEVGDLTPNMVSDAPLVAEDKFARIEQDAILAFEDSILYKNLVLAELYPNSLSKSDAHREYFSDFMVYREAMYARVEIFLAAYFHPKWFNDMKHRDEFLNKLLDRLERGLSERKVLVLTYEILHRKADIYMWPCRIQRIKRGWLGRKGFEQFRDWFVPLDEETLDQL
jgi:hypothetical protein